MQVKDVIKRISHSWEEVLWRNLNIVAALSDEAGRSLTLRTEEVCRLSLKTRRDVPQPRSIPQRGKRLISINLR